MQIEDRITFIGSSGVAMAGIGDREREEVTRAIRIVLDTKEGMHMGEERESRK